MSILCGNSKDFHVNKCLLSHYPSPTVVTQGGFSLWSTDESPCNGSMMNVELGVLATLWISGKKKGQLVAKENKREIFEVANLKYDDSSIL